MKIYAHRANNKIILRRYLSLKNIDGIEVDLSIENGKLVARHGPSPIIRPSLPGKIMGWIDYKFFYRDPYFKLLSISFEDILEIVNEKNLELILDVKNIDTIVKVLESETPLPNDLIITSRDHFVIRYVKETMGYKAFISIDSLPLNIVDVINDSLADGVSINYVFIEEWLVDLLHDNNYYVYAWTVNEQRTACRLENMGVDAIITDIPQVIVNRKCR